MNSVYYQTCILLITIFVGYFLRKRGILTKEDAKSISKLMTYVTLPCIVVKNLNGVTMSMDILAAAVIGLVVNTVFFLSAMLSPTGGDRDDRVVRIFSMASFNVGSYAIPVLSTFISPAAMAGVLAFNYPGTAIFTYGVNPTAANMVYDTQKNGNLKLLRDNLIHNVPTITCIVMLLMCLLHIALPARVAGVFNAISEANSTLAMLSIGILLDLHVTREDVMQDGAVVLLRMGTAAITSLVIYFLAPVSLELKLALILVVFAPIASCNPVLALHCGYQGSRVAVVNSIYLLVSIVCMSGLTVLLY